MRGCLRAGLIAGALVVAPPVAWAEGPLAVADHPAAGARVNGVGSLRARVDARLGGTPRAPAMHRTPDVSRATLAAARVAGADPTEDPGPPPRLTQAYWCLAGGTIGTAAAFFAGAENLVNTIAGGVVPTANQGVLLLGIGGIVFATFCGIGQAFAPVYLYYTEPPPAPAPPAAAVVRHASFSITGPLGAFGQ